MNGNRLTKDERLCGDKRISHLFAEGQSGFVYPFRYLFSIKDAAPKTIEPIGDNAVELDQNDLHDGGVAFMISVSKKYHKRAYKRNLIKRRTREAFRTGKHELTGMAVAADKKIQVALVYVSKEVIELNIIRNAVGKILTEVSQRL